MSENLNAQSLFSSDESETTGTSFADAFCVMHIDDILTDDVADEEAEGSVELPSQPKTVQQFLGSTPGKVLISVAAVIAFLLVLKELGVLQAAASKLQVVAPFNWMRMLCARISRMDSLFHRVKDDVTIYYVDRSRGESRWLSPDETQTLISKIKSVRTPGEMAITDYDFYSFPVVRVDDVRYVISRIERDETQSTHESKLTLYCENAAGSKSFFCLEG